MRNSPFWWVLIGFMILLDFYVFQSVKVIVQPAGSRLKIIIFAGYWILSIGAVATLLLLPYLQFDQQAKLFRTTVFAIIAGLFFLTDDLRRGVQWVGGKLFISNKPDPATGEAEQISRSLFLSWAGMIAGGGVFASLIYGFGNKYRYQVKKINLSFGNLPLAFSGLRIVQISDIHCGSLTNKEAVKKGVVMIMKQKPDLILFTGDLVNNVATEMKNYMDVFNQFQAPLGVYSILGNHDYGDYVRWDSPEEKSANLEQLKKVHQELGWKLLLLR